MKYIIILITLFVNHTLTFSQNTVESRNTMETLNTTTYSDGIWVPAKPVNNFIKGSVYLFPNWIGTFKVVTTNGDTTNLFNLNYNIKNQTIESSISKDSVFQYDSDKIDCIFYSNAKYKVFNSENMKGLFLEIINNEKVKVYKGYSITVETGSLNPLTQEKLSDDNYVQNFEYYFFVNGKFEKLKLSKKTILNLVKDKEKEKEVKDYTSKNNLSYTDDKDVKNILAFYSTLL